MFFSRQLKSNDQKNISKWITQKCTPWRFSPSCCRFIKDFNMVQKLYDLCTNAFQWQILLSRTRLQLHHAYNVRLKCKKKPHTYTQYCVNECDEIASGTMQLITGTGCRNCTKLNHRFFWFRSFLRS